MLEADLPQRQSDVLRLIASLTQTHGYPPTLAELAKAMGLRNRMTVHQHVVALKKKGLVHWQPGLNRSLKIIDSAYKSKVKSHAKEKDNQIHTQGVPLVGTIAAGQPIDAIETNEYLEIESRADSGCFALKVKGDSMIEDGIFNGDVVIIKPQPSPNNGDIVVAVLADGTATLKRFYKEKGKFRLQPANSQMEPIMLPSKEDLQIQGVVVGLFRKF